MPIAYCDRSSGRRCDAAQPTARPTTNPSVTSCSTNRHQTESLFDGSSAYANASTAGNASPSLRPDSRLSECLIMRGTRGFVTTLDDSTGSVGDRSAPTRRDSVQLRSVSALVTHATDTHVKGIASTSLRRGG